MKKLFALFLIAILSVQSSVPLVFADGEPPEGPIEHPPEETGCEDNLYYAIEEEKLLASLLNYPELSEFLLPLGPEHPDRPEANINDPDFRSRLYELIQIFKLNLFAVHLEITKRRLEIVVDCLTGESKTKIEQVLAREIELISKLDNLIFLLNTIEILISDVNSSNSALKEDQDQANQNLRELVDKLLRDLEDMILTNDDNIFDKSSVLEGEYNRTDVPPTPDYPSDIVITLPLPPSPELPPGIPAEPTPDPDAEPVPICPGGTYKISGVMPIDRSLVDDAHFKKHSVPVREEAPLHDTDGVIYEAGQKQILDRWTEMFARTPTYSSVTDFVEVTFEGLTPYSEEVDLQLRATAKGTHGIVMDEILPQTVRAKFGGACKEAEPFKFTYILPMLRTNFRPREFKFDAIGPATLELKAFTSDYPDLMKTRTNLTVIKTQMPSLAIIPLLRSQSPGDESYDPNAASKAAIKQKLINEAVELANHLAVRLPDDFPLASQQLTNIVTPKPMTYNTTSDTENSLTKQLMLGNIAMALRLANANNKNANANIVIGLTDQNFFDLFKTTAETGAVTNFPDIREKFIHLDNGVIVIPARELSHVGQQALEAWVESAVLKAEHEIVHSLDLSTDCPQNIHNLGDTPNSSLADGCEITHEIQIVQDRYRCYINEAHTMGGYNEVTKLGSNYSIAPREVSQCTYDQLIDKLATGGSSGGQLRKFLSFNRKASTVLPDQEQSLIRFHIRVDGSEGSFNNAYDIEGAPIVFESYEEGDWSLELLNSENQIIEVLYFKPLVFHEETQEQIYMSLAAPKSADLHQARLKNDGGLVLDTLTYSENLPQVAVVGADRNSETGILTVFWEGADSDGDNLAYTVLAGATADEMRFRAETFESSELEAMIDDFDQEIRFVQVMVTDGSNSVLSEIFEI